MPIPAAPIVGGGRNNKLVGNTPLIFTGDRSRAEEFITQWQLYEGVNITNDLIRNAYQQAMLFLTYIQGPIVNEWVKGVNAWLRGQIINQRWAPTDERLWNEVFDSFNRQFANVMEQEDAQAALAKGLQLERGDLDKLITDCYGRSTVVSDLDGLGFVLNVRWRKLARAGLSRSPYNGAMDKHTRGECVSSTKEDGWKGLYKVFQRKRDEVQGLYKVCTKEDI
jgi:hypothetical protein